MPSYYPDPVEYILANRKEGKGGFGTDLFSEGLRVNFRRKPFSLAASQKEEEELLTAGDADFVLRKYLADAQVPSAHAESVLSDAKEAAADALEKYDSVIDPETRKRWQNIADVGRIEKGSNWFTNVLNVLDAPGELVRLGIADLFADTKAGVEISGQDYLDALFGNEEEVRARLGADFIGEGQFLAEGSRMLRNAGWSGEAPNYLRGGAGIVLDVVTDPLTWISFGTIGLGKKAAIEGAQAGIAKASREAIEAVGSNSASKLTDTASKEAARRMIGRIDDIVQRSGVTDARDRIALRQQATERVLAEETAAVELTGVVQKIGTRKFRKDPDAIQEAFDEFTQGFGTVPRGTSVQAMIDDIVAPLADKRFADIAKANPWYTGSKHVPNFAKGGLQIGAPIGRRRLPLLDKASLRVPGTETNRLLSKLLGRPIVAAGFKHATPEFKAWIGRIGARLGTEQATYKLAREGNLWSAEAAKANANTLVRSILTDEAISPLRDELFKIKKVVADAGFEDIEVGRIIEDMVVGTSNSVIPITNEVVWGAVRESVDGTGGIREVFETFHDMALRVGMDLGKVDNYIPMVVSQRFGRIIDTLRDAGIDLSPETMERIATSPDSRVGMEILARYLYSSAETALGAPGVDKGYSQFAKHNKATIIARNALIGHQVATELPSDRRLAALVGAQTLDRLTPTEANRMVAAALNDLQGVEPAIDRKVVDALSDGAFKTDFSEIFEDYVTSMSEAIQYRALLQELQRVGLAIPADAVLSVSQTLTSVAGRLTDPLTNWIDDFAASRGAGHQVSRLVNRKVGGRTLKIPALAVHHPKYVEAEKKVGRVFSRVDRRGREMTTAVNRKAAELGRLGFDQETAERIALMEADSEIAEAIEGILAATMEEAQTLQQSVLEMGARNLGEIDDLRAAAQMETRKMIRGAQEAVAELESQVRKSLNLPDPARVNRTVDLMSDTNAPAGFATPIQAMAQWSLESATRRLGLVQEYAQNTAGRLTMASATESDIARSAVFDLANRLVVTDATIGELVGMAGPRQTARMMYESNFRMISAGYNGVGSLTDDISRAVEAVEDAEFRLLEVIQQGLDAPQGATKAARQVLRDAEKALDVAAAPLAESTELLGDIVEHVAQTVDGVADNILISPIWQDAWTLAVHKQGLGTRGEFAENIAESVAEGFDKVTQKELTERGAKGAAREVGAMTRQLWAEAASARTRWIASQADLGPSRIRRATEAMLANDQRALPGFIDEVRHIIGSITDSSGRPLFDPARVTLRNGRIVMEPAEQTFITLANVIDDIHRIVGQPGISDMEALTIAKRTWDDNPGVIRDVSEDLDAFFAQLDSAGNLPRQVEDIAYLNDFVRGLEHIDADLAVKAPRQFSEVKEILDLAEKALQRKMGVRKLEKLWRTQRDALFSELPAEQYDRLADVVGSAISLRTLKPSKFPAEWRSLVGEADQAFDLFTMDVAAFRRQSMDIGEKWADTVADDIEHFYGALEHLFSFADDTHHALRESYQGLVPFEGGFDEAFKAAREAATKLRKNVGKAAKDRRLAEFLPPIPTDGKSLNSWLRDLDKAMKNWEPVTAGVPKGDFIPPELFDLAGQSADGLVMTPGTALMLENLAVGAATLPSPYGIRMAADAMREWEKWWKAAATVARPTFVPRNVMGGIINNLIIGVGPRHYAFVRTNAIIFRNAIEGGESVENALKLLPPKAQPYFEAMWASGLLNKGFGHTIEAIKGTTTLGSKINPLSTDNIAFQLGGRFMEHSEDFLRAAAFVRHYDPNNPSTQRMALEMAMVANFDYSSLTKFESALRRFIPFFVWTRRNIPLQMRALIEQPGHALRLLHTKENVSAEFDVDNFVDEVGFNASPWLSAFAIKTPVIYDEETPFWQRLILDPDIPLADLEEAVEAFSGGPRTALEWGLRSISPAYSAPIGSIFKDYDTVAPTGLREIMMAFDWMGADPTTSGDDYIVPGAVAGIFNTLTPFLGEWTRTAGLVPSSGAQAAKAGFNIEDGIQFDERIKAGLLSLGRALGAHLQTPGDTRSQAFEALSEVRDVKERMKLSGTIFDDEEEMNEYIRAILAREGIQFTPPDLDQSD